MAEDRKKPITQTRRVIKLGNSYAITLPPEWVKQSKIKAGDDIPIVADAILKIVPMPEIE